LRSSAWPAARASRGSIGKNTCAAVPVAVYPINIAHVMRAARFGVAHVQTPTPKADTSGVPRTISASMRGLVGAPSAANSLKVLSV
jgi:hypothetical protein